MRSLPHLLSMRGDGDDCYFIWNNQGLMMHVTLVEINVHDDKVEQFIDVFRQNHLGSIKEPGNLRFDVLQDPQVPTRFYIYEAYVDEQAVAFHKTTPHYKTCVEQLEPLMTGPRTKKVFMGLMP
ncbi:putative autoinducer 2-degrading protein LsrG [Salmonella enterica subsp. enterica serovar Enteritidis str. 2010K-0262]|nr:putative autoinducer 2-degrading protein LsrG [Salmonella enterica subsp. enterica serovar Enteritidis str. 2009K0958]EPI76893.1 putative autoinducer 2-degrading protein LsrG [Salmonella enterica subsp. enterica serovar Enteritidis str. 08-1080]EPI84775.1 putative autoinducer 2-degrading protein LsrG [Salmonella enterica subsp. enterica serovar Enteritidis str. 2009K1651]EPI90282.1 putative autoinducer 2-degrading protein LsrG [Salmonella enterica subsp. enterica serovar Enteritidis str. 2010